MRRNAPGARAGVQPRAVRRADPRERDCVVAILRRGVSRPERTATAGGQPGQSPQRVDAGGKLAAKQARIGGPVASCAHPIRRRLSRTLQVARDQAMQQPYDRIASCDPVVVGQPEIETLAVFEREKTERLEATIGREACVEFAFHFTAQRGEAVRGRRNHAQSRSRGATVPFIASPARVEFEPRYPEQLQLATKRRFEPNRVDGLPHTDDVHGIVWMQRAPAQDGGLEKVEPSLHPGGILAATARRCRIIRCASRHQCFLMLNQTSAATTRLPVSTPSTIGGGA